MIHQLNSLLFFNSGSCVGFRYLLSLFLFRPRQQHRECSQRVGRQLKTKMESKQQERLIDTSNVRWQDRIHALGRLLASILRHRAIDLGLSMRSDGYVRVNDLLNLEQNTYAGFPMCSHTVDEIKEAVRLDDKQRFKLVEENGQLLIRANQGHSIEIVDSEKLFRRIQSPDEVPICVHGSYKKHLESICRNGLSRMHRVHIHFATGLPTDNHVINGVQDDAQILIHLDVQKAFSDGMKLYISENGVVLTEGFNGIIPPEYFSKIETRQ